MPAGFRVFNQITLALKSLHWLIMKYPINFKAFLLHFEGSHNISSKPPKLFGKEEVFHVHVLILLSSSYFVSEVSACVTLGWVLSTF